jgi:hypothetical protein
MSKLLRCAAVATGEELLASWVAKDRGKGGGYFTARVPKMAFYGAFISTSLTHFLLKGLRIVFAGRESSTAKVLEILAGMLVVRIHYRYILLAMFCRKEADTNILCIGCAHPKTRAYPLFSSDRRCAHFLSVKGYRESWFSSGYGCCITCRPSSCYLCAELFR